MTDTYVLNFNVENPPDGTADGEMLNQALARLRRIFLSEIEIYAVKAVILQENGSVLQDGDLVNRLAAIPILSYPETDILVLQVTAPDSESMQVLSDYILTSSGREAPVALGIPITILPQKETLSVSLVIKKGSVITTDSVYFSPVTSVTFRPIDDEDMEFTVELVRGFTEDDFNNFYAQALQRMKNGGGKITTKSKRDGRELLELKARQTLQRQKANPNDYDDVLKE